MEGKYGREDQGTGEQKIKECLKNARKGGKTKNKCKNGKKKLKRKGNRKERKDCMTGRRN